MMDFLAIFQNKDNKTCLQRSLSWFFVKYEGTFNIKSEFLIEDEKIWMFLHCKKAHFMVVLKFFLLLCFFGGQGKINLLDCKL